MKIENRKMKNPKLICKFELCFKGIKSNLKGKVGKSFK